MKPHRSFGIATAATILLLAGVVWAQTGVLVANGTTQTWSGSYAADQTDQSIVYVLNGGLATLNGCTLTKTGNSSNLTDSSQNGTNAGILAKSLGQIFLAGGSVTTSASGANGLFAYGEGSVVTMTSGSIDASGSGSHGIDATYGGRIVLVNVDVTTHGDNASALATDFGGGTVSVNGGTILAASTVSESHSAGIYSTGAIAVDDATVTSNADCGGVIDGSNTIALTNTQLTGALDGIKVHNTAGGTENAGIIIAGGSLTAHGGSGILVTGASGHAAQADIVVASGATISASNGYLVQVLQSSQASFTGQGVALTGSLRADATSTLIVLLGGGTTLTGGIVRGSLSLDGSSGWYVTANSALTEFIDDAGIIGSSVINVFGNGHDVHYDSSLPANEYLDGQVYSLVNGGVLTPAAVAGTESRTWGAVKAEYR
jgi:hypothetical protein